MGKIYLVADTHFHHDMLAREGHRPPNYTELIIENWKKTVSHDDITIHLGDVIFKQKACLTEILAQIPGTKFLVRGNHDRERSTWYMNHGFDFVFNSFVFRNMLFTHVPVPIPDGIDLNIHGHLHANLHHFDEFPDVRTHRHRLVSMELSNYKPIPLDEVMAHVV